MDTRVRKTFIEIKEEGTGGIRRGKRGESGETFYSVMVTLVVSGLIDILDVGGSRHHSDCGPLTVVRTVTPQYGTLLYCTFI